MLGKLPTFFGTLFFRPQAAPPSIVGGLALLPPVAAGLLLFRLQAAELLAVAVLVGGVAEAGTRLLKQPRVDSPLVAAVVAVALVGGAAPLALAAAAAALAALLEPLRARFVPTLRIQVGLIAYAAVLLASRGAIAAYSRPGTSVLFDEPIRFWHDFYPSSGAPIDSVRLYVGNVPGPVFATSLLAVVVGMAWLWYARRLSLAVLAGAAIGALAPIAYLGWAPVFHLASGPFWFCAGLILADRRHLPVRVLGRPLIGLGAGAAAIAARGHGFAIEAAPVVSAAIQVLVGALDGAAWLAVGRHRPRSSAVVPGRPKGDQAGAR